MQTKCETAVIDTGGIFWCIIGRYTQANVNVEEKMFYV